MLLSGKMVCAIEIRQVKADTFYVAAVYKEELIPITPSNAQISPNGVRKLKISPDFTYEEAREMAAELAENCF